MKLTECRILLPWSLEEMESGLTWYDNTFGKEHEKCVDRKVIETKPFEHSLPEMGKIQGSYERFLVEIYDKTPRYIFQLTMPFQREIWRASPTYRRGLITVCEPGYQHFEWEMQRLLVEDNYGQTENIFNLPDHIWKDLKRSGCKVDDTFLKKDSAGIYEASKITCAYILSSCSYKKETLMGKIWNAFGTWTLVESLYVQATERNMKLRFERIHKFEKQWKNCSNPFVHVDMEACVEKIVEK